MSDLLNSSINSTLSRTVLTSGVTLISIVALIIFGGEALRSFSIATFFGIVVGTYSSLFIATPVLVDTISKDDKHTIEDKHNKA